MKQELSKNKYLYKRLKLEEIKNPQYFLEICTKSNLIKFLIRLFFNKENFIKFFDFRIISSLILHDLKSSKTKKNSILNFFLLITLSIFLYRLNNKAIIEKKYLNLVKVVSGHINYYKYKEKNLKEIFNKKNTLTFTHQPIFKGLDLKKKKKYSMIRTSLKKKIYVIHPYNKNLVKNSEWWKFWIIKEILPSWKISSNYIKKIENLLKKKNTNDLKYFFKFYITNILCKNYYWEKKFNSIFFENSKKSIKIRSNEKKKILEDTFGLQIFFAFCEKLIFEIENPLKSNNLNSIIQLENSNTNFVISADYKKKSPEFNLVKKNIIQNLKIWDETDSIIAKSYILIKKKGWFFFNNYAEFYLWQLYKKGLFKYKKDLNKIDINKNKLDIKLFKLKSLNSEKKNLRADKNLSKISYQMSKYILYNLKKSNKLISNYLIIDQNLKLKKKKLKIKKKFNLIETNFVKSNKNFLKSLLNKKLSDRKNLKNNITSTIWNTFFFNQNKKNIIKSSLFLSPFFKNYLTLWIKNLFIENEKSTTNTFFLNNKQTLNFSYKLFSNILSIDQLSIGFSSNKEYKKKIRLIKKPENKIFRHFTKSDNYRLIFLFKTKKSHKTLNFFIFLNYAYKIIYKKKNNIKKFILLVNSKSSKNIFYLLWFCIHKCIGNQNIKSNKKNLFQINHFISLTTFLDKLNLLIIKYNLFYIKTAYYNLNYQNQENFKLEKNLLITKIISEKEREKTKVLIEKKLKKKLKIYNIFSKFYTQFSNKDQLIYNYFYKNLFLVNKIFYYKKNINLRKITKIIIDQNLLNWKKKGKNYFYNNSIKKTKYIYYNFNKVILISEKNKNKKTSKFFIEKQKNLLFLSNKINFLNNKNLITKWSNKLNKKNISSFYNKLTFIFLKNRYKFSKLFIYSPKIKNIKTKNFYKIVLNKQILLKQITFNIYYKLNTYCYFDKILITNFFINYFNDINNNKICTKIFNSIFFSPIWQNEKNYFSSIKISNEILLNSQFFKPDTLELLNFLYYSNLSSKKNLNFYLKKNKKNNLTYTQLIKSKIIEKKNLSNNQLTFFHKKKNKNSNIELQIYKTCLSKTLKKFNYKKLMFLYNFDLNNLFNSLVKFNPVFYKKTRNLKKLNFAKNLYIQNTLKQKNNVHQINYFENNLLFEFFIKIQNENNQIVNWTNKLFITKYNFKENLIDTILNNNINTINLKYEKNKNTLSYFSKKSIKLISQIKINQILKKSVKWAFVEKYIPWFFTFKWWKYIKNIVLNSFLELLLKINDQFNYILLTTLQNKKENFNYLLKSLLFNLKNKIIGNSFEIWNLRLLKEINKQHNNQKIIWPSFYLNFVINWNKEYVAAISFIIFNYFLFQKYFSNLLGLDYFELWKYFEIIQSLIDSSRGKYLDSLLHNNSIQFIKSENLLMHFFRNLKHYIKNAKFYLFKKKKINKLLIKNKGLDLSRRERKLLVQSLITDKSIEQYRSKFTSNTSFKSFQFGNSIVKQYKFTNYLENLTENYQKSLVNYPFHQFYLAENLVFLSYWQKSISLNIPWQISTLKSTLYKKPVPLELRLFSSKGILLIGSLETGRSYLVKNLAANSFVPLIKISISKLLYNKPDILTESWMNILMESLRRLNLILELAKKLSPCIIWMQNIHELNVNRSTQNVESDPTFLLGIFLKYFQTGFSKKNIHNIVIIGSTHLPRKVDPALISPNRLDRLINIRMFNLLQRQKKLLILLSSKHSEYFYSKNKKSSINEFGHRTIGYNARDLAELINEILLITIVQNQSVIEKKTIRLAFHRQTLGSTYINNKINFTHNYGTLFYKVGKVLVQNLFIKNSPKNPLYFGNDLWKKKFYYLSKWYLEPSLFESTIKEFIILPHVLGCLAGLAARDSLFILENKPDNLISLDKYAENDFYLACNILESLLIEFSWLEIFEKKNTNKKNHFHFQFQPKNPLYMIKKGLFSIINQNKKNALLNKSFNQIISYKKELFQLTSNITWAPKVSRLNFIRTNLFNWINRPNEFKVTYNFDFSQKKEFNGPSKNSQFFEIIQQKTKEQLPYERILSRIRRRNVQELEFQLEDILLEEQFLILGFSRLFTEYQMEYRLLSKPMVFIGGRFLWDPTGLLFRNHHFIFSRQSLFIDEEMLRRLYVTYGARREREKSRSSQKIKQFFLRRGYGRDSINDFSINWWNQLPFIEKNNVETFKRIEGIGVQLKRPQVFTPVYLYQRWLIENPLESMSRFELLNNQQRWLKVNNLLFNDSFIYYTLLEIYQYLLNFFIFHQVLLNEMTKILLRDKWLFQNEIEYFINLINKMN
uniref:Protein Ycf2 n=1 Tax=Ulota bruchii TaxID=700990 RepID=A0A4D6C5Y8_9BRYO|nr:Ycf2 [Ulota bruchii]QBX99105.1 Ycf2 [Ulota bruchii]